MTIRSLAKNLPRDPDNPRNVLGWGIVRNDPWHFVDIYGSREVAEVAARRLGPGYAVEYGSHELETDNFMGGAMPPD
ncbi:hypothetical protein [Stutzerimonas nitrititolerans]|uniref:hypothetical protein n=1 Tax=Stutzerimonas nitrititolerans TaxID=2482751 RepID=UPI0028AA9417|nr:hypothetical protein [Stutzerimonas nitrititolerans]